MNIIQHVATTTKYRVEERTIDTDGNTTGVTGVLNATDRGTGLDLFRSQLARNPGKFAPGTGRRLVLVEAGDR